MVATRSYLGLWLLAAACYCHSYIGTAARCYDSQFLELFEEASIESLTLDVENRSFGVNEFDR